MRCELNRCSEGLRRACSDTGAPEVSGGKQWKRRLETYAWIGP